MKIYEIFHERIRSGTLFYCPSICSLHSTADAPLGLFMLCFKTYPCSWLKSMIIIFLINFMLKISVVKFFSVKKSRKLCFSKKGFSKLNTSSATFWKRLYTHFDHVTKVKTSLKINSRIIEQSNRLPDHLLFLRLWTEKWVKSELVAY